MVIAKDVSKFCVSRVLKNFNEGSHFRRDHPASLRHNQRNCPNPNPDSSAILK
jgi:hypothetical protein